MQRCLKLQIARCRAECRSFAPKIAKKADWVLTTAPACGIIIDVAGSNTPGRHMEYAAVAHLVERHLAKVEVASSSLVGRSITEWNYPLQYGPVAQLVRAPACHAGGRRFEPDPGRFVGMSDICLAVLQVRPPQQILKFLLFPTKSCFASFRGDPEIRENRSGGCEGKRTEYAAVAHLVERHLAKVEVASSSLVGRSNRSGILLLNMVTWPSGKARVCKTLIHQFKSGRHLQKIPGC